MSTSFHPVEWSVPGVRRVPRQRRSQERYDRVIAATRELIVELGPAEVNTTVIAERADVSVAWIYSFFDDRQAIFDLIVLEVVDRVAESTQAGVLNPHSVLPADRLDENDWRTLVRAALHANADVFAQHPEFLALWCSEFRSSEMLNANRLTDADQAQWIYDWATSLGSLRPGAASMKACQMAVRLSDAGLEFAFAEEPAGDRQLIDQLGDAIIGLIAPHTIDE